MDDSHLGDDDTLLCNFAFNPRDSDLVSTVIDKVPDDQLAKFGIKPHESDVGKAMWERKLDGLNGRLLYKGWVLIWMRDAVEPLSVADKSLLKLSPGRLFPRKSQIPCLSKKTFQCHPTWRMSYFWWENSDAKPFPNGPSRIMSWYMVLMENKPQTASSIDFRQEPQRRAAILLPHSASPTSTIRVFQNTELETHDPRCGEFHAL
jgi:hypothetical protein